MKKLSLAFLSGWEAFEVGNFEEIQKLMEENPQDIPLLHLSSVAYYLEHARLPESFETSHLSENSIFQPLLKSIYFRKKFDYKEAFSCWKQFLETSRDYLIPPILSYGVKLSIEAENYIYALELIKLDTSPNRESYYAESILHALYYLKKFSELLTHFKRNIQFIPENSQNFFMVGMALLNLKKYKEAEYFLRKFNSFSLPKFEDLKIEMQERIQKISLLEQKTNLNFEELKELGFAYLFTQQYQKAEKILKLALTRVA